MYVKSTAHLQGYVGDCATCRAPIFGPYVAWTAAYGKAVSPKYFHPLCDPDAEPYQDPGE